jgi:hypothetical protein
MIPTARTRRSKDIIVVTESGMLHRLRKECPDKNLIAGPTDRCACADCRYMKMNTLQKLRDCLANLATARRDGGIPPQARRSAAAAHARAVEVNSPAPGAGLNQGRGFRPVGTSHAGNGRHRASIPRFRQRHCCRMKRPFRTPGFCGHRGPRHCVPGFDEPSRWDEELSVSGISSDLCIKIRALPGGTMNMMEADWNSPAKSSKEAYLIPFFICVHLRPSAVDFLCFRHLCLLAWFFEAS